MKMENITLEMIEVVKKEIPKPLIRELSRFALRFAAPVLFGPLPRKQECQTLNNGTATLLSFGEKRYAVTCSHVIDGYRQKLKDDPSIIFQIGNHKLNPVSRIIDENQELDLATIDLSGIDVDRLETLPNVGSSFHEPSRSRWPPAEVKQGNFVAFGGFPGKWRKQPSSIDVEFGIFSSGACHVASVFEDHIVCQFERQHWISSWQEGPPKDMRDLGGLSGSPVFAIRQLNLEFIGIAYVFSKDYDLLYIRPAKYLNTDGSIVKPNNLMIR